MDPFYQSKSTSITIFQNPTHEKDRVTLEIISDKEIELIIGHITSKIFERNLISNVLRAVSTRLFRAHKSIDLKEGSPFVFCLNFIELFKGLPESKKEVDSIYGDGYFRNLAGTLLENCPNVKTIKIKGHESFLTDHNGVICDHEAISKTTLALVKKMWYLTNLESLTLANVEISKIEMEDIQKLTSLKRFEIIHCGLKEGNEKPLALLTNLTLLEDFGHLYNVDLKTSLNFKKLTALDISSVSDLTKKDIQKLKNLAGLKQLSISQDKISEDVLEAVATLKLKCLALKIFKCDVLNVSKHTTLTSLTVKGYNFPLDSIFKLTRLSFLRIVHQNKMCAQQLKKLTQLTRLKTLIVPFLGYPSPEAYLKMIGRMTCLKKLSLFQNRIDSLTVASITHLTHLTHLDLTENPIGDEGLLKLTTLKNLKILQVNGTKITEDAVSVLIKDLTSLEQVNRFW